jgi:hypothetical protein
MARYQILHNGRPTQETLDAGLIALLQEFEEFVADVGIMRKAQLAGIKLHVGVDRAFPYACTRIGPREYTLTLDENTLRDRSYTKYDDALLMHEYGHIVNEDRRYLLILFCLAGIPVMLEDIQKISTLHNVSAIERNFGSTTEFNRQLHEILHIYAKLGNADAPESMLGRLKKYIDTAPKTALELADFFSEKPNSVKPNKLEELRRLLTTELSMEDEQRIVDFYNTLDVTYLQAVNNWDKEIPSDIDVQAVRSLPKYNDLRFMSTWVAILKTAFEYVADEYAINNARFPEMLVEHMKETVGVGESTYHPDAVSRIARMERLLQERRERGVGMSGPTQS